MKIEQKIIEVSYKNVKKVLTEEIENGWFIKTTIPDRYPILNNLIVILEKEIYRSKSDMGPN